MDTCIIAKQSCANLGTQIELLSEAIAIQEQLKSIENEMRVAYARHQEFKDSTHYGDATYSNQQYEKFLKYREMHNQLADRKVWIDAQLLTPDQLLTTLDQVKHKIDEFTTKYTYTWRQGEPR